MPDSQTIPLIGESELTQEEAEATLARLMPDVHEDNCLPGCPLCGAEAKIRAALQSPTQLEQRVEYRLSSLQAGLREEIKEQRGRAARCRPGTKSKVHAKDTADRLERILKQSEGGDGG